MKTPTLYRFTLVGAILSLLSQAGCTTVHEGPVSGGGEGSRIIRGTEPEPTPIPQTDVPTGQSPLRHTMPDKS